MTKDTPDDLDLTPTSKPLEVREVAEPSPAGPNDGLGTIYSICTGQPSLGNMTSKDVVEAVGALKQERDRYYQILQMIATRPRIDPANTESMADVGTFAWKHSRRTLGLKD
jgi:hypothetical protein